MTDDILNQLATDGYVIIRDVIPSTEIDHVRKSVAACLQAKFQAAEQKANSIRLKGHRIGGSGVQALPGIINHDQSFAPYLADDRLVQVVGSLFGKFYRITNTSGIANHPGNDRGYWHADWPYNQTNAAHIPVPYVDAVLKLSSLWVLTEFTPTTGGTYVLPGSHRDPSNPSGGGSFDRETAHPDEIQIAAPAGSVVLFDSRLWHCVATNHSKEPRYAMNIGYAPWWLNQQPQRVGSADHTAMVVEPGGKPNETPLIPKPVFDSLPENVKPMLRHWVEGTS
jgi:ectoine hydroxylase-related dioxygenase (phytanoyl-CoA dioxygenase family)